MSVQRHGFTILEHKMGQHSQDLPWYHIILKYIETRKCNYENKNEILIILNEIRKNYRSERMILFIACNLLLIRSSCKLDYVLFM